MNRIFLLALIILLSLPSCSDKEDPILKLDNVYLENLYGPAPEFTSLENPQKNVLVEEFTGHKCTSCPPAAEELKVWLEELHPRLSAIAIHAGSLAAVGNPPFDTDFNTPDGNAIWGQIEGGFNPAARIDRRPGIFAGEDLIGLEEWRPRIDEQLSQAPQAALQLVTQHVPEDGIVNIHVHTEFLNALQGQYALIVAITESKIISGQEDGRLTPPEIEEYEHNHALRDIVTLTEGLPIATNPAANSTFVKSFTYKLGDGWVPENCHVIAFVVDRNSSLVLNVVEGAVHQ